MHLLLSRASNCAIDKEGKEKVFSFFKRPEPKTTYFSVYAYTYIYIYIYTHIWGSFLELE